MKRAQGVHDALGVCVWARAPHRVRGVPRSRWAPMAGLIGVTIGVAALFGSANTLRASDSKSAPLPVTDAYDDAAVLKVLAAEAERRGLGQDRDVERRVTEAMVQLWVHEHIEQAHAPAHVTEQEVEEYLQAHASEFATPEYRRAHHVLLKSRRDAEQLLVQARAADVGGFKQLAAQRSIDTETNKRGGDLQYFDRQGRAHGQGPEVDPQIAAAVFQLKELGDVSPNPVQVGPYWSVVKLTGRKGAVALRTPGNVQRARTRIVLQRRQQALVEQVAQLKKQHPIQVFYERADAFKLPAE
jgi:peptidyl-prolyl cis-trans isomerase C